MSQSPWISPWIAVIFSVAAFIFYVIAASGYSKDYKVLKGCQWFYYHQNVKYYGLNRDYFDRDVMKVYYGLKGYYVDTILDGYTKHGSGGFYDYDHSQFNDEWTDYSQYKDNCDGSGKSAFALTVVACILSIFTIITGGAGFVSGKTVVNALKLSAVLSIISCLFGMIAVGIFMTTCYKKIYNETNDADDDDGEDHTNLLHYGNGFKLVITAISCNFFAFIHAIVNIIVRGDNIPLPVPVADVNINATGGHIPLPVADVNINVTGGFIPLAVAERK